MSGSVLFDVPGPRARRRNAIIAAVGSAILLLLVVLVIRALAHNGEFTAAKWNPFLEWSTWRFYLLTGIWNTLKAAIAAVVLAMIFGFVFGVGRLSQNTAIRWISGAVVEFFRAVPVLIMMIFFFGIYAYNGVFPAAWNPFAAVVTALTLYNGSVIAELVRSGVFGLPKGQAEAGLSVGLTPGQTLRAIQLPQAITAMLPALVSQLVVILKDTALGTIITYPELLQQAQNLASARSNVIPALLVAAALFISINYLLTWLAGRLEARINNRGHAAGGAIGRAPTVPGAPVDQAHASALTPREARANAAEAP